MSSGICAQLMTLRKKNNGSLLSLSLCSLPDLATASTGTPCFSAMNPSTEKMTNPPYKLVPLFTQANMMQSL